MKPVYLQHAMHHINKAADVLDLIEDMEADGVESVLITLTKVLDAAQLGETQKPDEVADFMLKQIDYTVKALLCEQLETKAPTCPINMLRNTAQVSLTRGLYFIRQAFDLPLTAA